MATSHQQRRTCLLPNCHKPVHVDPVSGVEHDYCGRTHAKQALGDALADPHGCCHVCKLDGCEEPVHFEADSGRVHDFCCASHATLAIERGEWQRPLKGLQGRGAAPCSRSEQCALNGCAAPRYRDPATGVLHDYCGKSHALKAASQGLLPAPPADPTVDVRYRGNIGGGDYEISRLTPSHAKYSSVVVQFESQWSHPTQVPTVVSVLQIRNSPEIYEAYRASVARIGNEQRRWHGTSCRPGCNFAKDTNSGGNRGGPCGDTSCPLCNIAASGFQMDRVGTGPGGQRMNLRYGAGLYFRSVPRPAPSPLKGSDPVGVCCAQLHQLQVERLFRGERGHVHPAQAAARGPADGAAPLHALVQGRPRPSLRRPKRRIRPSHEPRLERCGCCAGAAE